MSSEETLVEQTLAETQTPSLDQSVAHELQKIAVVAEDPQSVYASDKTLSTEFTQSTTIDLANGSQWAQAELSTAVVTDATSVASTTAATTTASATTAAAATASSIGLGTVAAIGAGVAVAASGHGSDTPSAPADTTPPAVALTAVTDDVGSVTGALSSGSTTDDTALVLSGTCEAGATVNVYNGSTLLGAATVTAGTWTYTATVADATTYAFNAKATDAAGNTSAATSDFTVIGDTHAPVFSSGTSVTVAENTDTSTAVYNATADNDTDVTYTLSGTDSLLFHIDASTGVVVFNSSPNFEAPADAGGNNVYDFTVTATDLAGNASHQDVALTVSNVAEAGDAVIDLGVYGKLMAPVQVEGNWYYVLDMNGDGVLNRNQNTSGKFSDDGSVANADGTGYQYDTVTHNVLDAIFNQDINGNTGGGGNSTDTYRYATINGVHLALPTAGGQSSPPYGAGDINHYQPGTAVSDGAATNPTYNDLLAIWDAHNGVGTGTDTSGAPSGWQAFYYWSATPFASGHAVVHLGSGGVFAITDSSSNTYAAFQVL